MGLGRLKRAGAECRCKWVGCWLARVLTWEDDRLPLWRNIQTLLNKYLSWDKISFTELANSIGVAF